SAMVMAATLHELGAEDRDLYLFDTFTHMPLPGEHDVDVFGRHAGEYYEVASESEAFRYLTLEAVQDAVASTGFPRERTHFVQGMVEETIPSHAPEQIALCRLDTDWYESTTHEMEHLYPRLAPGGVLIIDDYGHFQGSKKAVDEYLAAHELALLLHRIDFTGRLVVKPA
ncbi:MAG: TylF/MycF/NovP-related O-methyltransferase, partial [Acidimicrobiales bacterium]